jgi:hypothetical protein
LPRGGPSLHIDEAIVCEQRNFPGTFPKKMGEIVFSGVQDISLHVIQPPVEYVNEIAQPTADWLHGSPMIR